MTEGFELPDDGVGGEYAESPESAEPSHVFDDPERFIVGTVGQPGERAFYLQAIGSGAVVTVGLEKAEVSALAEGMVTLLESVGQVGPAPRLRSTDWAPLDTPFSEDFHVNELSVAWD